MNRGSGAAGRADLFRSIPMGLWLFMLAAEVALLAASAYAQATQWEQQMDGWAISRVAVDATGIYVVGSQSNPGGQTSAAIAKFDSQGSSLWVRNLGPGYASAVAVKNNFVYIAGTFVPSSTTVSGRKAFLAKFDTSGTQIWIRSFGSDDGSAGSLVAVFEPGVYVGGYTYGPLRDLNGNTVDRGFVRKYDLDGNESWTRQFGVGNFDRPSLSALAADSTGLYLAGLFTPFNDIRSKILLQKFDFDGNEVWTRPDSDFRQISLANIALANSGIYVGGSRSAVIGGEGIGHSFLNRYDETGNNIWSQQEGASNLETWLETRDITADQSGVYAAGAHFWLTADRPYGATTTIKKYDLSGSVLWSQEFDEFPESSLASAVAVYGDALFVGVSSSSHGIPAGILMRLDSGAPPVNDGPPPQIANAGIRNSASLVLDPVIAQGSLFTVFGSNLGPASPVQATRFPLATSGGLAGTSIRVVVNGISLDAPILYTSEKQVAAILPSTTPLGTGTLTVNYNGLAATPAALTVVDRSFAIYTVSQNGAGPGVVQNVYSPTDIRTNTLFETARPGQTAVLWGTGLGAVSGNEAASLLPGDQSSIDLHLWVGGRDATVLYRGRSGCCAGVDQINFVVPNGIEGCYVPITVQIGDSISPYSSMSIRSSGGTCSLPFGLTTADLNAARARGSIRLGNIFLDYGGIADSIQSPTFYNVDLWGEGNGFFFNYPVDDYGTPDGFTFSDSLGPDYSGIAQQGANAMLAVGTCMVGTLRRAYPDPQNALDAGGNIAITSSKTELLTPSNTFYRYGGPTNTLHFNSYRNGNLGSIPYSAVPPSTQYIGLFGPPLSVANNGGGSGLAAVGSFVASPGVPQGLVWANIASTAVVNRTEGVRVTWGGGDPDGFVYINGIVPGGTGFSCLERASARSFTVPPSVTLALPAAEGNTQDWGGPFLYLVNMSNPVRFDATGLDAGFLSVSVGVARRVSFR